MKLIERQSYLNTLQSVRDIHDIKIITGVRRSGKTKLMDAYVNQLLKEDVNVVRIKLNLKEAEKYLNADNLYNHVNSLYIEEKNNYLLIDEIQLCNGFEKIINSLYEEERFDIYLTGSNAFLLSSDLATMFGGRVFEINMYPFSFYEFLEYYPSDDIQHSFDKYVEKGGMPGSYPYNSSANAMKYVNSVFKTTIVRDIVQKYKIENEELLLLIADFLMDNIGSSSSVRNIANKLSSSSYKTNDKTVGSYISYLCKSFMFYPVQRYDIQGKRFLETERKYYLADLSFRFSEIGTRWTDYGHLYENIVAIELLRRGFEIYVGQLQNKEIDFVIINNGSKTYIQVADDISNNETFKREVTPLMQIKDAYPRIVLARTKHKAYQYEGIQIIDIAEWLVSQKFNF